jgi:hypothetical protein
VIVLIGGLGMGWFIGHSRSSPQRPELAKDCPPGNHLIVIGPKASDVSEQEAVISASEGHKVFWISKDANKDLTVTFRYKDFPPEADGWPPFEGGDRGKDQAVPCSKGVCRADLVNHNHKNFPLKYKYYQKLGEDEQDAGIIIQK